MSKQEIDLPEDGALECWCQVSPFGEYPGEQDGARIVQVCDMAAFDRLVEAFAPEVLVDFEHRADETDDTTAAGWAQELRCTPEAGLEARIRWTDVGADDLRNRRRRYLSGVWRCDADGRPLKLLRISLTNTPNMPNRPVLNKADPKQPGEPIVGAPQPKDPQMKQIAALYGLPETASEADILAAAKADRDKLAALQKQIDEMQQAQLATEAESVAAENKDRIANKDQFKGLYVRNKALALEFLACLPKPEPAPVCNKDKARPPSFAGGAAKDAGACKNKYQTWRAMADGPAKDAYLDANADDINDGADA